MTHTHEMAKTYQATCERRLRDCNRLIRLNKQGQWWLFGMLLAGPVLIVAAAAGGAWLNQLNLTPANQKATMKEYQLNVLQDGSNKSHIYVFQTSGPVDEKLLRVAAMVLDGGYSNEQIEELHETAGAYVSVESK